MWNCWWKNTMLLQLGVMLLNQIKAWLMILI